ncbi:hypothetical protein ACP70R_013721 [Stipagrostis hirtigluma subsp. patula]
MVATHGHGGDRLSALPDATLARVLSYLPTDEAARTSVLSRRWRDIHATVPVVHLVDTMMGDRDRGVRDKPICFEHRVNGALLCRDPSAPIRAFRLDVLNPTTTLLDQWLIISLDAGAEEVDVKLRYWHDSSGRSTCPFGPYELPPEDFGDDQRLFKTPPHLFSARALRRLRLTNWTPDVPRDMSPLASLETLVLKRVMAPDDALRRLLSNCPGLADLTLERCPGAKEVTVASAHLRSFAMVCCHGVTRVVLQTPCLRSLRYKGSLPPDVSFFSVQNNAAIASVTIDICEDIDGERETQVAAITRLIRQCTNLTFLHLTLRPEMACCSSQFTSALRGLPLLRHLELKGCVRGEYTVGAVAALLRSTRNLEVLSLFPLLPDPPEKKPYYLAGLDSELEEDRDDEGSNYSGDVYVPKRLWKADIKCFKHRLRRINLVGYRGRQFEKVLAKFLLSKAAALEKFSVSIAPRQGPHKHEMARELESWRFSRRTRVTYE